MYIVAGLGNPDRKYAGTRHNIGFDVITNICDRFDIDMGRTGFKSKYGQGFIAGEKVLLLKPQTYMNESGRAVGPLMRWYKIAEEDVFVIYDDMDLPVGKIRLRQKGSAGGHNGIKSIISCLGSDQFNRIKIGVGRPAPGRSVVNHVLANFEKEEQEEILASVDKSVEALRDWIKGDNFIQTMNRYN